MTNTKADLYGICVTKKKCISNEHLGEMIERIENNDYKIKAWYPTMEDAMRLAEDPVGNYEFIIWILYSNPDLELTEEQQEVEDYLECLLKEATCIINDKSSRKEG